MLAEEKQAEKAKENEKPRNGVDVASGAKKSKVKKSKAERKTSESEEDSVKVKKLKKGEVYSLIVA